MSASNNPSHLPGIDQIELPPDTAAFFLRMERATETTDCAVTKDNQPIMSVKGAWTPKEDALLTEAVMKSRPIVWDQVAESVPGRTALQCKERWRYRLDPTVKRARFEKWEDDIIIAERNRIGNHWTVIAGKLPGRTPYAVKNRWYSLLRNLNLAGNQ